MVNAGVSHYSSVTVCASGLLDFTVSRVSVVVSSECI